MEEISPEYFSRLKKDIESLLQELYANETPTNELLELTGKTLVEKVSEAYKQITVDFTTPDAEMLTRLTRDVWHFSAAKNYQQMRDLTLALKDENGKLREFTDFKEAAQTICEKYNETWLRTEYNFAVAASQNAARWNEFEKEADSIPFLKYQTVGDDAVRESHRVLDGVVKHINDPFWATHFPPNGWGCRCEAVQELDGERTGTATKDTPSISISPMFRTNLAQTGLIYPKEHPYYNGIPKAELRKAIAYLPPKNTYQSIVIGDYEIEIHPLHGDKELTENINICKLLKDFDEKAKIQLLPILNEKDEAARKLYLKPQYIKKRPGKNPDALLNGKPVEFETSNGSKSSIQNAIKMGKKQADFVIIHLPDNIDLTEIDHIIKGQIKHYQEKENLTIWAVNGKGRKEYTIKQKR